MKNIDPNIIKPFPTPVNEGNPYLRVLTPVIPPIREHNIPLIVININIMYNAYSIGALEDIIRLILEIDS
jgi:hypothetical protein